MYQLYGALGAASLAPQCVLEVAAAPYELIEIDISADSERDPEYLKLNPHGRIPTLVYDGQVIIESAAICIYLADKHPESGLSPAVDHPDRSRYLQWMVYLTNTLQETLLRKLYTSDFTRDAESEAGVVASASAKLDLIMAFIDRSLGEADGPCLLGNQLSSADIYLNMLTGWDPATHVRVLAASTESGTSAGPHYPTIATNNTEMLRQPTITRTFKANGY